MVDMSVYAAFFRDARKYEDAVKCLVICVDHAHATRLMDNFTNDLPRIDSTNRAMMRIRFVNGSAMYFVPANRAETFAKAIEATYTHAICYASALDMEQEGKARMALKSRVLPDVADNFVYA